MLARDYNRVSLNSTADLRRSAVKRRRCFLTEEENGEDSDDSLRDPDFAQEQNMENEESDGEPSPTPQPPPKKRAAISSKNPPVTSTTPLPSTRRMTMPTPSAILSPLPTVRTATPAQSPVAEGRIFFIKGMKQFRSCKDPWTEEEKEACALFYNALPNVQKSETDAILKEMTNLKEESYNKIYHKIRTAWTNALKKTKNA